MYKINTTYLTTDNKPAKVLWIESESYCRKAGVVEKLMTVLHEPFTENERIRFHHISGFFIGAESQYDLTEIEYLQEFINP